jgi:hypothetical protein
MYKIKQNLGDDFICNNAHILSLHHNSGPLIQEPFFISAEDYYKSSKHFKHDYYGWKTGVEFAEQFLPIDPYWLGLWLGDGTSGKPAITVGHKDYEISNYLKKWAKQNHLLIRLEKYSGADIYNFSYKRGSGYSINPVILNLKNLNLFMNKHIPEIYLKNSSKNRLLLLAGLIDSDGYKSKSGSIQFSNTNKELSQQVLYLARSLGLKASLNKSIKGIKSIRYKTSCYTVTLGGTLSRIPSKLKRKQGHDNPQKKSLRYGITVCPIGIKEYYGFAVDGDHQFLLGDFTVTHNSAFPVHFAGLLDFDVWDFNINASHSKWVGEGPERMREALKKISKASHLVVRIDEYDRAIGSTAASGQGMHEAHKQVESEFMNWLQNNQEDNMFIKNDIFLVLTTNHKENITGPLLRSGRADLVIDINEFDDKSMKEAFLSASRRMKNRGVVAPIGYTSFEDFAKAIEKLDIDKLIPIVSRNGFTVRDIDILLIEMATHDYYFKKNGQGIAWCTENFIKVLENSTGSTKDEETCELVLGDRFFNQEVKKEDNPQLEFGFAGQYTSEFNHEKFVDVQFFK